MLKRTVLATLVLVASGQALGAEHAILNVEGEIQINGKTIINENGELIAANDLQIVVADYEPSPGIYTSKYTHNYGYPTTCDSTETFGNNAEQSYEETCSYSFESTEWIDNEHYVPNFTWETEDEWDACNAVQCLDSQILVTRTQDVVTVYSSRSIFENSHEYFSYEFEYKSYIEEELFDSWTDEGSRTSEIYDVVDAFAATTTLGKAVFTYYAKHKVIESSNPEEVGNEFTTSEQVEYLHHIDQYVSNGVTHEDCLVGSRTSTYSDDDEASIRTGVACKGKGFILEGDVGYEPLSNSFSVDSSSRAYVGYRSNLAQRKAMKRSLLLKNNS